MKIIKKPGAEKKNSAWDGRGSSETTVSLLRIGTTMMESVAFAPFPLDGGYKFFHAVWCGSELIFYLRYVVIFSKTVYNTTTKP